MISRLAEFFIFGLVPFVLSGLLMPGALFADELTISGEVSYRERIALPQNAVLVLELVDTSLADQPASIVAERTIEPAGQPPIRFSLAFDRAVIRANTNYALRARIMVDNQQWFINDERHSIDPLDAQEQKLLLKMAK